MLGLWDKRGFKEYWKETIALYDHMWATRLIRNDTEDLEKQHPVPNKIGVRFAYTNDGTTLTYYYVVQSLPRYLAVDFKEILRDCCQQGVRMNFFMNFKPYTIDWNSAEMQSRLRVLSQVDEDKSSKEVTAYNIHALIGDMDKQQWIRDSLSYLAIAEIQRGRSLMRGSILITLTGEQGRNLDVTAREFEKVASNLGLGLKRILYDIPDVLTHFSPFSKWQSKSSEKLVPVFVLSDEIVGRFNTLSEGTQGMRGVYMGSDIYSLHPVLKRFKMTPTSAENVLVSAETGGGKSNILKLIALQLVGQGCFGTIMDIEGHEYQPFGNFISHSRKVRFIDLSENGGNYVDCTPIIKPTGNPDIDNPARAFSINSTLAVFSTLVSSIPDTDGWIANAVDTAVSLTYAQAGVTTDKDTWHLSENLTYFDVYEKFKWMRDTRYIDDEGFLQALTKVIARLDTYFSPNGARRSTFANRILLDELVSADLVIASFGMAGKSPDSVDQTHLALMQLGAAQISYQRSIFSFLQGKFNFKIWEEFQRWGNFPNSEATINVAVTGGRKLGDINFIATNKLSELLTTDRFGLIENITSFVIGAIGDKKVRDMFCERTSLQHMASELEAIALAKKPDTEEESISNDPMGKETQNLLNYAFLLALDKAKYGVVKALIHPVLAESKLFKTGVDISKKEVSEDMELFKKYGLYS